MVKANQEKIRKLRIAVRYLLEKGQIDPNIGGSRGAQVKLAEHFKVSRQRVHQIVVEERQKKATTKSPISQAS